MQNMSDRRNIYSSCVGTGKPDWPNIAWDRARLEKAEQQFLMGGGVLVGTVKHLPEEDREQLTVEAMSDALLSSAFAWLTQKMRKAATAANSPNHSDMPRRFIARPPPRPSYTIAPLEPTQDR
jgi:hypothetical protein